MRQMKVWEITCFQDVRIRALISIWVQVYACSLQMADDESDC